jgi:hypothetical protein
VVAFVINVFEQHVTGFQWRVDPIPRKRTLWVYVCCSGRQYGLLGLTMSYLADDETMAMKRTTIGTIALIGVMGPFLATYAALTSSRTFSNTTGVAAIGVGVFSDSGFTNPVTSINWGMMNPGTAATYAICVRNNGTVPVTLTMTTGNWNPPAASGNFTVTWDKQNAQLAASSYTQAVLTLNVSASAIGIASVTFDITITGTQ